jgi:hypothetical protein
MPLNATGPTHASWAASSILLCDFILPVGGLPCEPMLQDRLKEGKHVYRLGTSRAQAPPDQTNVAPDTVHGGRRFTATGSPGQSR